MGSVEGKYLTMARLSDWEKRLADCLARHQAAPAQWGVSDCYMMADDAVEAVTGARMYPEALGYSTERGAARKLKAHGFANVREAFAAKFREVPVLMAQRGDVGVIERDGQVAGGFVTAAGFATRAHGGPVEFLPLRTVTAVFRVE